MLETSLAAFGIGEIAVLILFLSNDIRKHPAARVFACMLIATATHLIHPFIPVELWRASYTIQTAIPALFWITCHLIFSEQPNFKHWLSVIATYSVLVPLIGQYHQESTNFPLVFVTWKLPEIFEYVLIAFAMKDIVTNWSSDLVESRRKLRLGFVFTTGGAVLFSIMAFNLQIVNDNIRILAMDITIFVLCWPILHGREELWSVPIIASNNIHAPTSTIPLPIEKNTELDTLNALMETGYYQQENLTLTILSVKLSLPEHKVRALINQEMGYRNFNQYLNELRIKTASKRLIQEPKTPITNIALDVGYRNISSFNRSFKTIHNMNPSLYRANNLLASSS